MAGFNVKHAELIGAHVDKTELFSHAVDAEIVVCGDCREWNTGKPAAATDVATVADYVFMCRDAVKIVFYVNVVVCFECGNIYYGVEIEVKRGDRVEFIEKLAAEFFVEVRFEYFSPVAFFKLAYYVGNSRHFVSPSLM